VNPISGEWYEFSMAKFIFLCMIIFSPAQRKNRAGKGHGLKKIEKN
jgi:hypothetical protein